MSAGEIALHGRRFSSGPVLRRRSPVACHDPAPDMRSVAAPLLEYLDPPLRTLEPGPRGISELPRRVDAAVVVEEGEEHARAPKRPRSVADEGKDRPAHHIPIRGRDDGGMINPPPCRPWIPHHRRCRPHLRAGAVVPGEPEARLLVHRRGEERDVPLLGGRRGQPPLQGIAPRCGGSGSR